MAEIQPNWENIYKPQANLIVQGNPALDMLRQKYTQAQQDRASNIKDFTNELAKLNFNGARDIDLPELQKGWSDIQQSFQKYRSENDPKKQSALYLEMKQKQNEWMYKAQQSRNENDEFHKDAALAHNANADLDPTYWDDMKKRMGTSTFDPKYQSILENKQNWMAPKVDWDKMAEEIAKPLLETDQDTKQVYNPATGRYENHITTSQSYDHDRYVKSALVSIGNDPNKVRAAIRATGEQDPAKAVQVMAENLYQKFGKGKSGKKVTGGAMAWDKILELARTRANINNPAPPTPAPQEVPIPIKGDDGEVVGQFNLHNYRAVSIPKATVIPTKAVDDHGNEVQIPAGEVRVIGYAEMPVTNKDVYVGTKTLKKGHVALSDYEQNNGQNVTTQPIMHIQVDHKGHTRNYFVSPDAVNVNATGQKNQNIRVQDVKQSSQGGTISYTDADGTVYNIPSNKAKAFEMSHPKAKKS